MADEPVPASILAEIESLRQENQRWRGRFGGALVALLLLFVVALVQFAGTFAACRVLYDARREAEAIHAQNKATLTDVKGVRDEMTQAVNQVRSAELALEDHITATREKTAVAVDAQVRHLLKELGSDRTLEQRRADLAREVQELTQAVTRLDEEIHDLLAHGDAAKDGLKQCPPTVPAPTGVPIRPTR